MPNLKETFRILASTLDAIGVASYSGTLYFSHGVSSTLLRIGYLAFAGGESIGEAYFDKMSEYPRVERKTEDGITKGNAGIFTGLGTLGLGNSIIDAFRGNLEKLPADILLAVSGYSKALGEMFHYLSRK
jgi:hypothetical protein